MERQSSLNAHLPGDLPGDDFAGHVASIVQSPSREPLPGLDPVTGRRTSDDNMNTAFDDLLAGIPEGGGGEGGGGGGGGGVMRGQSALDRMPSIPADAGRFFDEKDLMQLDGMLDFDVDADAAAGGFSHGAGGGNGGGNAPSYHTGGTSGGNGGGYTSGATSEGSPSHGGGGSSGGHGGGHGGGSEDYGDLAHGLDPKDPKYKRRIQNRLASARFRAKAKERQTELDRLKHQVTQLRREKFDLESQCGAAEDVHHGVDRGPLLAETESALQDARELGAVDGERELQARDDGDGVAGEGSRGRAEEGGGGERSVRARGRRGRVQRATELEPGGRVARRRRRRERRRRRRRDGRRSRGRAAGVAEELSGRGVR
ncbi:uncharacterized protein MICPUCDRAFT_69288 [Micromonas pusilla CCMP1545]|uniref:Predicted protein n=1 Tax=Micromonas pusilla (strain CCMP1545) TaxID=564608 RepID=C1MY40_MICPC|nr:uncharacterized protein MICPUCDRAFT_69288 [Micromonas pusilla CCMP1545]EEH55269.1 predicted protein [Micromonas pusilla CCMP1545]|eukprot:XP_003060500.1 predicted protein [Micromonas pusilla CCMP1545]